MKLLDRYIATVVIGATGIALLVIMGLNLFFEIIRELDDVGKGDYNVVRMLQYVALTLPRSIYDLFPTAALLGGLTGMGALAVNSELIAMRACGFKLWRIVRSVLQAGLLMLLIIVPLGEFVAPVAEQLAQQLRVVALDKRINFMGARGLWVRDETRYIYVRNVIAKDRLADLRIFDFDGDWQLTESTHVDKAKYKDGEWLLLEVRQSRIGADGVSTHNAGEQTWSSLLTPELIGIVMLKPENMAAQDIRQFITYLEDNGLDTQQYHYALWKRLVTPASSLVMLFISVPFVFGSLRSTGTGQRIFIGILAGFGFYMLSQLFGQMGLVYKLHPLLVSITPSVIVLGIGMYALRRI
ncbi:MAG: LPS export ABC transporter permease LptG [Gammaproteobacteria bacterium]|jgi:lipopolysaccharide export system permease protein